MRYLILLISLISLSASGSNTFSHSGGLNRFVDETGFVDHKALWRGLISGLDFFVLMDITIDGEETNLKTLEDKVIRGQHMDPRIHAAASEEFAWPAFRYTHEINYR